MKPVQVGDWVKYRYSMVIHFAEVKKVLGYGTAYQVTGKAHPVPIGDILEVRPPAKGDPSICHPDCLLQGLEIADAHLTASEARCAQLEEALKDMKGEITDCVEELIEEVLYPMNEGTMNPVKMDVCLAQLTQATDAIVEKADPLAPPKEGT